jgi:hypothetical protein
LKLAKRHGKKKHAKHMGIACTVIENWGCEETNLLIFQLILGVPNQHDFCYMVFLPNSLATFHSTSFFFKLLLSVLLCHFVPEFVGYIPAICLDFALLYPDFVWFKCPICAGWWIYGGAQPIHNNGNSPKIKNGNSNSPKIKRNILSSKEFKGYQGHHFN